MATASTKMSRIDVCNVQDFILSASALSTSSLDLSKKGITELPSEIPGCSKLECLYLEGNRITTLPDSLFTSCPNLRWLDLRNNKIETLPPAIEKLKVLRTLLLEGNKLKTLPCQLGRLCHLTGLNLSRNPLEFPPKSITEQGTKPILKYLRRQLNDSEEDDRLDSSDSNNRLFEPLHPIENNHGIVTANIYTSRPSVSHAVHGVLPLPLMRQATLHAQMESESRRRHSRPDTPSPQHSPVPKLRKKQRRHKKGIDAALRKPLEHSAEMKMEINAALDKEKARQGIQLWRDEARTLQRQQELKVYIEGRLHYPKAVDTAPFGTGSVQLKERDKDYSETEARLKAMDTQRQTFQNLQNTESLTSVSSLRDARESEVSERINVHMMKLSEQRKQAGIISSPSNELLEAEKRLAEAIARRKDFEDIKQQRREYRLTAFTGDEPF